MKTNQKNTLSVTQTNERINSILELEKITEADIAHLSQSEKDSLMQKVTELFNPLTGTERELFLQKVEGIINAPTRSRIWEYNHQQITTVISKCIEESGRMPSQTEIAERAGLSRTTVHKHLKEYIYSPEYHGQVEQFRFMASKMLAKVYDFGIKGDIAAAKLYFSIMDNPRRSGLAPGNTLIQNHISNQNNFIQINGTVLSQHALAQLSHEQLSAIESILKAVLPQPEPVEEPIETH